MKQWIIVLGLSLAMPLWAGSWIDCGDEEDFCNFKGEKRVAYGRGNKWSYKGYQDGVECSYKRFTPETPLHPENLSEPLKSCKYFNRWGLCSFEGENCRFSGTQKVAFGSDAGGWLVKQFSGGVHCSSQEFGQVGFNANKLNKCLILGPQEYFIKP